MNDVSVNMLAWVAATALLAWIVPRRWQPALIGLVSAAYLLYASPLSMLLLASMTAASYFLTGGKRGKHGFPGTLAVLALVLTALVYFKWGRSLDPTDPAYAAVPLGLSYYALRLVHYAIERWKGTLPEHSFWTLAGYLFFLPTLTAGPINLFPGYCRGLRRRRWDPMLFSRGCERLLYGCVKIVFIGNYIISQHFSDWLDILPCPRLAAYLDCFRYGANLYFQFAGFSDLAIGFALLIGFEIAENFNAPFLACNINEFWKRWHMTLSNWCREYVYMPVAAASRSPKLGVLCAMLILGLWHEFSVRYLVWGAYHGLGIACWQAARGSRWHIGRQGTSARIWTLASWLLTMNFVILSFAFTKELHIGDAVRVLRLIVLGN